METITKFLKTYKVWILAAFIAIFFVRSCNRGRNVTKLEKAEKNNIEMVDSLNAIITIQDKQISKFPEKVRTEKLNIYLSLDDTISRVDRSPQLMELHKMIKDSVKSLQK